MPCQPLSQLSVLAGDVSALYLAVDWQHMLVQLVMSNPDRRAYLAHHLWWTCVLLVGGSKQCLMLSIGACVFALRRLGCSDAIISWVQDHAQVISVTKSCHACCSAIHDLTSIVLPMLSSFAAQPPFWCIGMLLVP